MAALSDLDLLSLQALQTKEQMQLLDVVDSLRAQGLGELTALPQLIVCGDQSSGKSSVLEAISGVPFPRHDNLCTRFATEVILRRAASESISVTIIPDDSHSPEYLARLKQFKHDLIAKGDFPKLFELAMGTMNTSNPGRAFFGDILRVEICGAAQPQLTLVDLPGLIHSETLFQTAKDVELVSLLVGNYMKNPRSIILAVVSAKNDIGNQIVLRRAREVDPKGTRTLGIITKPDTLANNSSSEKAFITLARNEDVKFQLGWHVVKNLDSTAKSPSVPRDEQEAMYFKESNFRYLPTSSLGVTTLRGRLSKVLFDQIRIELPHLISDIETRISVTESELERLGRGRTSTDEQRAYLIELSQAFHAICRDAVRGNYDHAFFHDDMNAETRLCAILMNKHFVFAEKLRIRGAKWNIVDGTTKEPGSRTREEAITEACKLLKRSRGRELPGLPNPLLVGDLFREYSSPWESIAKEHIQDVWETAKCFLETSLQFLADEDVACAITQSWINPIMEEKLNSALGKLEELTAVHQDQPMTTNHYFTDNVRKLQQKNSSSVAGIEERLKTEFEQAGRTLTVKDVAFILATVNPTINPDMDMIAAEDAFDNMNAYYQVAMKLFMDNVPSLAIQSPIVRHLPSIFCPTAVLSMDADLVEKIAGQSEDKVLLREELKLRLIKLKDGARLCKLYAKLRPNPNTKEAKHEQATSDFKDDTRRKAISEDGKSAYLQAQKNLNQTVPATAKPSSLQKGNLAEPAKPTPSAVHSLFSNSDSLFARDTAKSPGTVQATPTTSNIFATPPSVNPPFTGFNQYSKGWSPATGVLAQTTATNTSPSGFPFGGPISSPIQFGVPSAWIGDRVVAQNISKNNSAANPQANPVV